MNRVMFVAIIRVVTGISSERIRKAGIFAKLLVCFILVSTLAIIHTPALAAPYLVYEGDGNAQAALTKLGFQYDLRSAANPVTLQDLQTHEALIVNWNNIGPDMTSGLDPAILAKGITGNVILTGHDPAIHYAGFWNNQSAGTFLLNAINYASSGNGTGLVAMADVFSNFSYLPSNWGVSSLNIWDRNIVTTITTEGRASGVYSGLDEAAMSNWINSYHTIFTSWGTNFEVWEYGELHNGQHDVVTIAGTTPVPIPGAVWLFGSGLIGLVGLRRRFRK